MLSIHNKEAAKKMLIRETSGYFFANYDKKLNKRLKFEDSNKKFEVVGNEEGKQVWVIR